MVKRWHVKWDETEIPDGDYVRASDYDAAIKALRAARPCVFNSRTGSWKEVLDLVDATIGASTDSGGENA